MVPSPPKSKIASAWSAAEGSPIRQSMLASVWNGRRFFGEHPSPKMAAARMCAVESSRIHHGGTEARRKHQDMLVPPNRSVTEAISNGPFSCGVQPEEPRKG